MANFDKCIDPLIKREGGYVNHPNDRGGPTKYGITIGALKSWRKKEVTANDVKNLTIAEAKKIYKSNYWDKLNLDKVAYQGIAEIAFDQAVNRGWKTGAKALQKCVNIIKKANKQTLLTVDGAIGPKSLNAISRLTASEAVDVVFEQVKESQINYVGIVRRNSSQMVFLLGWINRSHELLDTAKANVKELYSK